MVEVPLSSPYPPQTHIHIHAPSPAFLPLQIASSSLPPSRITLSDRKRKHEPHSRTLPETPPTEIVVLEPQESMGMLNGVDPEEIRRQSTAFASLLRMCGKAMELSEGRRVHKLIIESGLDQDGFVQKGLVEMYGKCGALDDTQSVFDRMHRSNVFLWNIIIAAYVHHGFGNQALQLFRKMALEVVKPDKFTFSTILGACSTFAALEQGRMIHAKIIDDEFESDAVVGTALVKMYVRCGSLEDARSVFDNWDEQDVISWNVIIAAYAQSGQDREVLQLYGHMQEEGVQPDKLIACSILGACTTLACLTIGKAIHESAVQGGFELDVGVGTALVSMYGKCGCLDTAQRIFWKLPHRNVVSWTAIIATFAQLGQCKKAFQLYRQMQQEEGVKPNEITYLSLLSGCANLADLEQGKMIHASIVKQDFELDDVLGTALINMYGKCGSLDDAENVFDRMHRQDAVSWTAMIASHAQNGYAKKALQIFSRMQKEGVKPDAITFVSILSACSHAGLVEEGCQLFTSMTEGYRLTPSIDHYACIVDIFGRAGRLAEAEGFIKNMSIQPTALVWEILLGACKVHGDVERGQCAAQHVLDLNPGNATPYVMLSSIHAAKR